MSLWKNKIERSWWKEAVIYQIYPRSFKDGNGDGIGDLRGIIEKLDYIASLGIDVVWLNPIFESPNDDNGYDISDYQKIMPEFGSIEDFDELLSGLHERGIRLVLDLVVNHSSDEHEWFRESRKSRDSPYRGYYHWWNAERGRPADRWSFFDVNADAWAHDPDTDAYYLHYFSRKQPDLNWENPDVRKEVYKLMRFWLDRGVDGFRMDVITFISKDTAFPELPEKYHGEFVRYYADGPKRIEYLAEMKREVLDDYDILTIAEGPGTTRENVLDYVGENGALNLSYHFEHADLGYRDLSKKLIDEKGWSLLEFKKIHSEWDAVFENEGRGTVYLGNHDQPRMVSRWGNDSPEFRELSAKMLLVFLLTMRGSPFVYYGDEIGMTNIRFDSIRDYRDIMTLNLYKLIESEGGDLEEFMDSQREVARDNGRTPFQWNAEPNAGFSESAPWIAVNKNASEINAERQESEPDSVLNFFRRMIRFRKENPVWVYGKYREFERDHPGLFCYERSFGDESWVVVLNFGANEEFSSLPLPIDIARITTNYPSPFESGRIRPYEAIVYRIR